jgi:thiol-disulfide isomerase/thioredoxin
MLGGVSAAGCAQQVGAGDRVIPSGAGGGSGSVSDQGYSSADGTTTIVARARRAPAGDLSGQTLDGATFNLADRRGDVVVVNVWASWCSPCRAESPALAAVSRDLAGSGVRFVGVNLKDSPDAARAFVRRVGIDYPSVVDRDGTKVLGLSADLPPTAVPATLVIDRTGRVAARALGAVDESRLRGLIAPILAEDSGKPGKPGKQGGSAKQGGSGAPSPGASR